MEFKVFHSLCVCFLLDTLLRCIDCAKLPEPEIVTTEVISPSEIHIRWHDPDLGDKQKIKDKRHYAVKYHVHKRRGQKFERSKVKDTEAILGNLQPNTTYVFRVKVTKGKRSSVWSKTAVNRTYPLETFIHVEATTLTSSSIVLAWTLPRHRISQSEDYTIFWSEEDQDVNVHKVKATAKSHIFHGLIPGRTYNFRLLSSGDNQGEVSTATVRATTYTDRPSKAPRDMRLKITGPKSARVEWSPPPVRKRHGQITQYKLQYKRRGSRRGDVCTLMTPGKPREFNLTDLEEGATYRVRVSARTVNGTGPYTKWDSIDIPVRTKADRKSRMTPGKGKRKGSKRNPFLPTKFPPEMTSSVIPATTPEVVIPGIPSNLYVVNITSSSVALRWFPPPSTACCPIVAYRLLVWDLVANQLERDIVTGKDTEEVINWLDPATEYAVNVSAFNTQGPSNQSANIYITTSPAIVTKLDANGTTVMAGGRANLTCEVTGDPIPEIDWYRDGMEAPYYNQESLNVLVHAHHRTRVDQEKHLAQRKVTSNLVMELVTPKHAGKYTCIAQSPQIGTMNKTVELHVHTLPSFISVETKHAVVGKSTSMSCVVMGIPLPQVRWSRLLDGMVFNNTRSENSRMFVTNVVDESKHTINKTLHFDPVTLTDEGNYTCQAKNGDYSTWRVVPLTLEVPIPPPVSNIRAVAISPSRISIVWDDPPDYTFPITAYNLVYRTPRSLQPISVVNTTEKQIEIHDLEPSRMYKVKVRAYNTHGIGKGSREIEVKTLPNTNLQPANVSAVALNSSTLQLDWEAPRDIDPMYIRGFNIYYRKLNSTEHEKLFIAGSRNKQFLIGLGKSDTFFLRISTVLTWNQEAYSQWIKIRKNLPERKPPPPPRRLIAVGDNDSITLTWRQPHSAAGTDRPEVEIKGYKIRYGAVNLRDRRLKQVEVSGRAISHKINRLIPSQTYRVAMMAYNEYGNSQPVSVEIRTRDAKPDPVFGADATAMSSTEILVQWLEPKRGPVTQYHVRYWRPGKRDKESAWLRKPETTQYIAGSLRKNSQYRFEIIPYNNMKAGEAVVLHASTMIDIPDTPPKTVTMKAVNATALRVVWEPPPKPRQNGPISGYKLVLKKKTGKRLASFSVDGTRRNYTFKNLEPSMMYKVRVAAMTVKGTGPSSKWISQSTEKIKLRAPESPASMDTNVTATSIYVTWKPPRDIGVPVLGYIVGHGRYIPEVYRYVLGSTVFNYSLSGLTPDTGYIVSVRAYNHFGESLPKFVVGKTQQVGPGELLKKIPLKIVTRPLSISEIEVTWSAISPDLLKQLDDSIHFLVRFSAVDEAKYQFINTSTIPITIGNLRKATKYEFSVKALRGTKETDWSLPVYNTTLFTVPQTPSNVTVTPDPKKHTTLTLTWTPPSDDGVTEYFVYSTTKPDLPLSLWEKTTLPGSRKEMRVHELMPFTTYYFHIQAHNKAGSSPVSQRVDYVPQIDPTAAPSDVNVHPLHGNKSTTVEVTWSPPATPLGTIIDYGVYYTYKSDDSDWQLKYEESRSCLLIGLGYNSTYRIYVRAIYSRDILSPPSPTVNYTTLSYSEIQQKHEDKEENREINASETDTPPTTEVATAATTAVDIINTTFDLNTTGEDSGIKSNEEIKDGDLRNSSAVENITDIIDGSLFEGLTTATIPKEDNTNEEEIIKQIMPPIGLQANVLSSEAILLMWSDTTLGKSDKITDNRYYTVMYKQLSEHNRRSRYLNSTDLNAHIDGLKPNTQYEFSVMVIKGRRQSTWSMSVINTTQEAEPGSAPRNLMAITNEEDELSVYLVWQKPTKPNGIITAYFIHYTVDDALSDRVWIVEGVIGDSLSTEINNLSPDTTYYFKIQAGNRKGFGPMSPIIVYNTPKSFEPSTMSMTSQEVTTDMSTTETDDATMTSVSNEVTSTDSKQTSSLTSESSTASTDSSSTIDHTYAVDP